MEGQEPENKLIEKVAELITTSERIVVFTGAGVSTESGIPDFRSPGGIWTKYDPDDFTYQKFLTDSKARKRHWKLLGGEEFMKSGAKPNPAHHAIVELERMGKLDCVITQNVDGLHEMAGNSPDRVIYLHGTMNRAKCLNCGECYTMQEVKTWLHEGVEEPTCPKCGGLLKPDAVFFGEPMPAWETSEAQRRSQRCDLCIVIGSSLVVYPAALMPRYAVDSGAKLVIINQSPTDLDDRATVVIRGRVGNLMPKIIESVRRRFGNA
jgi:NAD-dependent deacetylase